MIMVQAYDFGCGEAALASPGESQGLRRFWRTPFTEPLYCVGFGSPSWRPLQWRCKTGGTHHSTGDTPSVRFVGSEMPPNPTAPSEREPRRLRRTGHHIIYKIPIMDTALMMAWIHMAVTMLSVFSMAAASTSPAGRYCKKHSKSCTAPKEPT